MAHIKRIAEDDEARSLVLRGRQKRIRHGAQLPGFQGRAERTLDCIGEGRKDDVTEVALDAAVLDRRRRQVVRDIDENSCLVCPDLVEEDRRGVAEQHMAVARGGKFSVYELQAPEFRPRLRGVRMVPFAQFRGIPVRRDSQMPKVAVADTILRGGFDAQDLVCVRASDELGGFCFDDRDVRTGQRGGSQLHDEAAMVESAAFGTRRRRRLLRVLEIDGVAKIRDPVSIDADRVNVVQTVSESKLF